jgi:hypothetical protein
MAANEPAKKLELLGTLGYQQHSIDGMIQWITIILIIASSLQTPMDGFVV